MPKGGGRYSFWHLKKTVKFLSDIMITLKYSKLLYLMLCFLGSMTMPCHSENSLVLKYQHPATHFGEALPIGNGRLGAMVYGDVFKEKLSINDDTFWSGEPKDWNNPKAKEVLPQIKEALRKGDHQLADQLAKQMQGPYNQSYQPLANINIAFAGNGEPAEYVRELDLNKAIAKVSYKMGDVTYKRSYFSSFPNQVIVLRLEADKPGALNFDMGISGKHQRKVYIHNNLVEAYGKAPKHVDPSYLNTENPIVYDNLNGGKGMNYIACLQVAETDGKIIPFKDKLQIKNATCATIYLAARTSFNGFDKSPSVQGVDCKKWVYDDLDKLEGITYSELLDAHISDYQTLFHRLDFSLGKKEENQPVETYFDSFKKGENSDLLVLAFQMGRYLAISGSRPHSQALNLQGIWNENVRPLWSSNYTININTQMNYWPILPANLFECNEPLLDLIQEVSLTGKETARINYGCNGWVAHHNIDLWRQSAPVGDYEGEPCWANFTGGGTWLTMHLWEHYQYTQDKAFLQKRAYPILKGAVEFLVDWLQKDQEGFYVPPFAVSTEANFITPNGYQGSCAKESAEDIALNGELFLNFIATCDTLGIKDSLYYKTKDLLRHTRPYWIDPEGKIQEWMEVGLDRPKGYNKNHLSHLIGFHPGRHLIAQNNPDYIQAVKRTLELFEPESSSGGWNLAWKISFWARMRNAEKSYDFIRRSMNRLSSNLLSGGTNFQIDANMGYVAGVCEMLAQSHNLNDQGLMVIELLPALPKEWPSGHIYGLRTRGGFEIDMEWKDAQITRLVIKNDRHQGDPSIEIVMNGKRFVKQIPYHSETIII